MPGSQRRDVALVLAVLGAAVVYDLWCLFGPSRCPACEARRTVRDRIRGWHLCEGATLAAP